MKKHLIYILIGFTVMVACKKETKKDTSSSTGTEEVSTQLTSEQLKVLLDSSIIKTQQAWDSVIAQDNHKMNDIKRLLDEVSYNDAADNKRLRKTYKLYDEVVAMRYTLNNLNDTKIDLYDSIQNELISVTNELVESTPNIEGQPLAIELVNDISEADGMTFSKRGDFDIWAKKVNSAMEENPEQLSELGMPYKEYKQFGTFAPDDGH